MVNEHTYHEVRCNICNSRLHGEITIYCFSIFYFCKSCNKRYGRLITSASDKAVRVVIKKIKLEIQQKTTTGGNER